MASPATNLHAAHSPHRVMPPSSSARPPPAPMCVYMCSSRRRRRQRGADPHGHGARHGPEAEGAPSVERAGAGGAGVGGGRAGQREQERECDAATAARGVKQLERQMGGHLDQGDHPRDELCLQLKQCKVCIEFSERCGMPRPWQRSVPSTATATTAIQQQLRDHFF